MSTIAAAPFRLDVDGMDCPSCARKIEAAVGRLPGVAGVSVNVTAGTVSVTPGTQAPDHAELARAIADVGFRVREQPAAKAVGDGASGGHNHAGHAHGLAGDEAWWRTGNGRFVLLTGSLLAVAFTVAQVAPEAAFWTYALATLVGLVPIARRAVAAARVGLVFTIEMLMTIAAIGALAIGAASEAAVVVALFAVGELLESVAASQARRSIKGLADLTPKTALLLAPDGTREVAAATLVPGDHVLIRPGDRVPADGTIVEGSSSLDEAPVTGESVPRPKAVGDPVFAGTINADGALTVAVERAAEDNTIARIIRLVEEAQEAKAPTERFIERFSRWYMPAVVAMSLAVAVLPPLLAGELWGTWVYRALTLLLIACPCALVISTPAAIAAGLAAGARRGLLMKGGVVLETLAGIKVVALDKTGTLTLGRPRLTDILVLEGDERRALALAASLEQGSSHPIARAFLERAAAEQVSLRPIRDVKVLTGHGVAGWVSGQEVSLLRVSDVVDRLDADARAAAERWEQAGKSLAVLLGGDRPLALFAMRDEARPEAVAGLAALRGLGLTPVMLTGDSRSVGEAVAASLGIEARCQLMPEDKARIIGELRVRGPIAKVGDGINDAPALAAADVGIAMGSGTDVALETADAALLRNDIRGLAELVGLARATLANVRQNVVLALGLKAVFLVTTVAGVTGLWIAILADTGATVLVTANALRLLRYRFDARG